MEFMLCSLSIFEKKEGRLIDDLGDWRGFIQSYYVFEPLRLITTTITTTIQVKIAKRNKKPIIPPNPGEVSGIAAK